MGDLPKTSEDDLKVMGITPQMIRDALVAAGVPVKGDIVGYYLPQSGDFDDHKIQRALSYAKSDWVIVDRRPPEILDQHNYNQKFTNFDGAEPILVQYDHSVTVTKGIDYSQTKAFDVNVNANLPIGQSGVMAGFSPTISSTEVKSKSWSKTDQHTTSFPIVVPPHEGRMVTELTTETSETNVWEAQVGVQNAVGIRVDPAWYKPDEYYWFYEIQYIFPNNYASSRINRAAIDTDVDTTVSKLLPPGDEKEEPIEDEILTFESHVAKQRSDFGSIPKLGPKIGMAFKYKETSPGPKVPIIGAQARLGLTIDFNVLRPIQLERRALDAVSLKWNIHHDAQVGPALISPGVSVPSFIPDRKAPDTAKMTITYDDQKLTRLKLQQRIIAEARSVNWQGLYKLHFS